MAQMAFSKYLVEVLLFDGCSMGSEDLRNVEAIYSDRKRIEKSTGTEFSSKRG
jgi:hypothetical protein